MYQPPMSPNLITALRLPLAPLTVMALMMDSATGTISAVVLALILELTDIADGWMARRYKVVTSFGKLFDPFADAFCRFTLFLGLYAIGEADLWMILVIFYRDSSISFLRSIAAVRGVVMAARTSGKVKAIVQGVGTQVCFLALLVAELGTGDVANVAAQVPWWTMLMITLATAASWVDYIGGNLALLRDAWEEEPA
ncbi:MAG: CDP-alcohol phosphatidyltransferase family protein [Myxococcota bacterium]